MNAFPKWLSCSLALVLCLQLAGCGGGATSTSTSINTSNGSVTPTNPGQAVSHAVCPATSLQNSIANNGNGSSATVYMDLCPITDNGTPSVSANIPYVSIYLCAPGSTTACGWIDHVEVDTGSEGLRLLAEAIPAQVLSAMPSVTAANFVQNGSSQTAFAGTAPIGECYAFVSSFFWGGVRSADVTVGGMVAPPGNPGSTGLKISNLSLQVLNDPSLPATPPATTPGVNCGVSGGLASAQSSNANTIRANGIIGVGLFSDDCHTAGNSGSTSTNKCSQNGAPATYYACQNGTCTAAGPVINPVTNAVSTPFPITGVTVANPVSAAGKGNLSLAMSTAPTLINVTQPDGTVGGVAGTLTFGPINAPTTTLVADPTNGFIQSTVNGKNYAVSQVGGVVTGSYIDSGSNTLYFSNGGTTATGLPDQNISAVSTCPGTAANPGPAYPFACVTGGSVTLPTTMGSWQFGAGTLNFTISPAPTVSDALTLFNASNGPAYAGLAIVSSAYFSPGVFAWGLPFFFQRTVYFGIYSPSVTGTPYYGF